MSPDPAAAPRTVDAETLRAEELRLRYLEIIDRPDIFPTPANWQYIIAHAMHGLGQALYHKYLVALDREPDDREPLHQAAVEHFPEYLRAMPPEYAAEVVYGDVTTDPEAARQLIRDVRLFDAGRIADLIRHGNVDFALSVIDVYRESYTPADLEDMEDLAAILDALPEQGRMEQRRSLLGSLSMKYICPRGHVNDGDRRFCTHGGCGLDTRGLTRPQSESIDTFRLRLRALRTLLGDRD